jgi:bifunctional non-homologous end joining protein LigD
VVKQVADAIGAICYPKTSGATGMHIYFPMGGRYPFAAVKKFAHLFARKVHQRLPRLTSLERMPKERRRQVYLDYLQNAIGQTIAAPYCVRPRPGATVSAPLRWQEVQTGLHPGAFTLHNMPARLKAQGDLFRGVLGKGLDLEEKLEALHQLQ